jgi:hypothetical protein
MHLSLKHLRQLIPIRLQFLQHKIHQKLLLKSQQLQPLLLNSQLLPSSPLLQRLLELPQLLPQPSNSLLHPRLHPPPHLLNSQLLPNSQHLLRLHLPPQLQPHPLSSLLPLNPLPLLLLLSQLQ